METAYKILVAHQAWRKGEVDEMINTPREIGQAIQIAINALHEQLNFPDWSHAPEWANYYGIDSDGQRWWYEFEPELKGITYNGKGEFNVDNLPDRMKLYKRPE